MNDDFVTYELAVKLKEKGFRMPCIAHYCCLDGNVLKFNITTDCIRGSNVKCLNGENNIYTDAPTISQVLKWLRKEKKIYLEIVIVINAEYMCDIYKISRPIECLGSTEYFKTYEQAALAGIEFVLDNLI